jgi:hypothetical protein
MGVFVTIVLLFEPWRAALFSAKDKSQWEASLGWYASYWKNSFSFPLSKT